MEMIIPGRVYTVLSLSLIYFWSEFPTLIEVICVDDLAYFPDDQPLSYAQRPKQVKLQT